MSKFAKKILVSVVAAVVVAAVAVPPSAQAQTVAELQAQITALLAQITALQAQLGTVGGTTGGGVSGIPAGFMFNTNHTAGSTGSEVMYLQMALNAYNDAPIAVSGAGSPGSETSYFGPVTAGGVTAFQNKYASEVLTPVGLSSGTGFFGPSTRAKMNSLLAAAPSPTPGTPAPTPGTPAPTPGISTPGVEGSLTVTIASVPASGAILDVNETEAVTGAKVKANTSDILVSRVDLQFDTRPWQYISELTISDGTTSKTVSVTQADTTEVTVGTTYSFRVSGLNILVPAGTEKTLTVTAKAVSGLPVGTTTKNIILTFIANSIRGTDGAGLTQTGPTASIATRTITVQEPSSATLEITASPDNPKVRAVLVNSTAATNGVTLAIIDVKAKNNGAILRSLDFNDTDGVATSASNAPSVVYLYEGSTLLSSTSTLSAGTSTIANIDLLIPKDTTKTLTLKADLRKSAGNYVSGATSTIVVEANTAGFNAEDESTFAAATVTGSNVAPGTAYFYTKAPKLDFVSASITPVAVSGGSSSSSPASVDGVVRINVTAQGGDIYIPKYSATAASNGIVGTAVAVTLASSTLTQTFDTNADFGDASNDTYLIPSGTTKWFELSGSIAACPDSGAAYFQQLSFLNVKWGTTVAAAQQPGNTWTWGLTDFKTSTSNLPACS